MNPAVLSGVDFELPIGCFNLFLHDEIATMQDTKLWLFYLQKYELCIDVVGSPYRLLLGLEYSQSAINAVPFILLLILHGRHARIIPRGDYHSTGFKT